MCHMLLALEHYGLEGCDMDKAKLSADGSLLLSWRGRVTPEPVGSGRKEVLLLTVFRTMKRCLGAA